MELNPILSYFWIDLCSETVYKMGRCLYSESINRMMLSISVNLWIKYELELFTSFWNMIYNSFMLNLKSHNHSSFVTHYSAIISYEKDIWAWATPRTTYYIIITSHIPRKKSHHRPHSSRHGFISWNVHPQSAVTKYLPVPLINKLHLVLAQQNKIRSGSPHQL